MKRRTYAVLMLLPLMLIVAFLVGIRHAQSAGPIEVGSALGGQNAVEFVGQIDQDGFSFAGYGYLTHISGLTDTLLFSATNPLLADVTNARFTYSATATLTSRHVLSTIFALDSIGTIGYYYHPVPGADFADPASFSTGIPIVTATLRSQNILMVVAPNKGIATNIGEFTQTGAGSFTLDGQVYQLGQVGLRERIWATGDATRTDPITPKSFTFLAGNAVVTGLPGQESFMPIFVRP